MERRMKSPRLLARLERRGAVIRIDVTGCRHGIAGAILDAGANYLLVLKANQKSRHDEVRSFFGQAAGPERFETADADHGRPETRRARIGHEAGRPRPDRAEPGVHPFPGLVTLAMVEAEGEEKGRTGAPAAIFVFRAARCPAAPACNARPSGDRNRLRRVMDVVFHDALMRLRTSNGPAKMAVIRHAAFNVFKQINDGASMKVRRKTAAWDDDYLFAAITKTK